MRKVFLFAAVLTLGCGQSGVLNKDLSFNATSKGGPGDVVFSHRFHVKVKKQHCSYCHPEPFKKRRGMTKFSMKDIWSGKFCGKCHNGKVAFSAKEPGNCSRCHRKKDKGM